MPSIKDVAREAGVAISTVSRVLGESGYVSEEARARVLEAVATLGYRPNRVARSLRARSSRIIGLIVSDLQNPFFSRVSRAVENAALASDYQVFICNADEDPKKEMRYLQAMMEEKVAGVIFSPSQPAGGASITKVTNGLPLVAVDRRLSGAAVDTVVIDNTDAADRLTETLITGDYRRIAGLFGARSFTGRERSQGFLRALERHGLEAANVTFTPAFEAQGFEAAQELLRQDPRPDALVCSSALLAAGAFRALRQSGVSMPGEMGFAVVDDPPWADLVEPAVTVIRQPAHLIGETAAELLLKRIEDPERAVGEVCLRGELITRASSNRAGR